MSLLENWRNEAYAKDMNTKEGQLFWGKYFNLEKSVYEKLLKDPDTEVKGTVKELIEKFGIEEKFFIGFLDGINESLVEPNPIEEMDLDTVISLKFDKEKLYYNMVEAKAEWLYNMPEWNDVLPEERRKELFKEQKKSGTVVIGKKVGRNDPCPCGSGKKFKFCCMRK